MVQNERRDNLVFLYVEKYFRKRQSIILDFLEMKDFESFQNHCPDFIRFNESSDYKPTMLLVKNFKPSRKIYEGNIIILSMDELVEAISNDGNQTEASGLPATVCYQFRDGTQLANFMDKTSTTIKRYVPHKYIRLDYKALHYDEGIELQELDCLGSIITAKVWNVGQGNTNSICDSDNDVVLFDIGASCLYAKNKLLDISAPICKMILDVTNSVLIISHWDLDHFNLLTVIEGDILSNFSCVLYPDDVIGATAKEIEEKIQKYCKDKIRRIAPAVSSTPKKRGIKEIASGEHFTLFVGEESRSKNISGLLLSITTEEKTMFFTGDHSNYQVWSQMYEK